MVLPMSLDGTSVKVNGRDAFVEFISANQINAIAPLDSAVGAVGVQVTLNGQASNTVVGNLQPAAPAFFTFDGKYLAATHADGQFSWAGRFCSPVLPLRTPPRRNEAKRLCFTEMRLVRQTCRRRMGSLSSNTRHWCSFRPSLLEVPRRVYREV